LLVFLLTALALFALPVGRRALFNQDEARFALLAREAVEHGHWLLPHLRGDIYLNKPPLFFWSVALLSWPFGAVTDGTAPLVSVVAALVTLLAVLRTGHLLWGWEAGWTAMLTLATVPFFFFMSHQVFSDMMLTAWLTWALYFFLSARAAPSGGWRLVAFYLCVAGGLATKGPAALMVLGSAVVVTMVEDGWAGLRRLRLPVGLTLIGVSALPWLLSYLLQPERSYVRSVVVGHYAEWYFRPATGSRLVAFLENLGRFLPWSLFLAPALWWDWHNRDTCRRALILWTVVVAAEVSLSGEQRARYFLPVMPLLALLVAEFLVRAPGEPSGRGRRVAVASLAVLLLLSGAAGVFLATGHLGGGEGERFIFVPAAGWESVTVALLLVVGPAAALVTLVRRRSGAVAASALALALGGILFIEGLGYPARYTEWHDVPGFAARAAQQLPPGARLLAYPDAGLAYDFYLRRSVREIHEADRLKALLSAPQEGEMLLLVRADRWAPLQQEAGPGWQILASERVARHRMLLLGRRP
jgi:4-amino-4-deoxy-L-arabinose transferase-like glycosyltransferase